MTNLTVSKWSANKCLKLTSLSLGDLGEALCGSNYKINELI
jgi:hypothetical protein